MRSGGGRKRFSLEGTQRRTVVEKWTGPRNSSNRVGTSSPSGACGTRVPPLYPVCLSRSLCPGLGAPSCLGHWKKEKWALAKYHTAGCSRFHADDRLSSRQWTEFQRRWPRAGQPRQRELSNSDRADIGRSRGPKPCSLPNRPNYPVEAPSHKAGGSSSLEVNTEKIKKRRIEAVCPPLYAGSHFSSFAKTSPDVLSFEAPLKVLRPCER